MSGTTRRVADGARSQVHHRAGVGAAQLHHVREAQAACPERLGHDQIERGIRLNQRGAGQHPVDGVRCKTRVQERRASDLEVEIERAALHAFAELLGNPRDAGLQPRVSHEQNPSPDVRARPGSMRQ